MTTPAKARLLRAALDDAAAALGSALDSGQRPAADALAALGARLAGRAAGAPRTSRPAAATLAIRGLVGACRRPGRGLYLHGEVGRGKTWLTTTMLDALATPDGALLRLHAFEAAQRLHAAVARRAGRPGALPQALDQVLGGARVLFLDELHAHDPGDAMILSRLVREAFARGVTLVATSNDAPRGLLPSPLYHHLVLPLVRAIEECCDVVEVAPGEDYRRRGAGADRAGWAAGAWAVPGSPAQAAALGLATPAPGDRAHVRLTATTLPALAVAEGQVHLHFAELCEGATSVGDALELADRFATLVLWAVPRLSTTSPDAAQRFANLVDVCWDRDARLVVLAPEGPDDVVDVDVRDRPRVVSRLAALPRA
jgi:cell division protein ZapE